jgi:diguanylate cyclase (GGDEF)-like protein/PAS domain S-box-containing protein
MTQSPSLQQQIRRLQAVLDEVGAYVFTKDTEGRYTYANRLVLELFGRSAEEVVGHGDEEFFDLALSTELRDNDRLVLEHGETLEREERNIVRPSGEERIYWTVKKPLRDEAGAIVGLCGISTDITARKRIEVELAEERARIDAVLRHLDAEVYMKDAALRYVFVNHKAVRTFGRPLREVLGADDFALLPPEAARALRALDETVMARQEALAGEESIPDAEGRLHHYWSVKVPVRHRGQPALVGFSTDITELVELKERLRLQSITDSLTDLHNRRHFQDVGRRELARSLRHGLPLTLVLIDIDHLKRINDAHGHPGGDAVLQQVAQLLQACVRGEDLLARVGGEEFAWLMPETDEAAAWQALDRARRRICRTPFPTVGVVTASAGVCDTRTASDADRLYAAADAALYRAKENGRNRAERAGH